MTGRASKSLSSPPVGDLRAPSSNAERAYREIKLRIMDGSWLPGNNELESEVAARLSMSRTPVREALVRLEHESLVTLIPRKGAHVAPLSETDVSETYYVLAGLEAMAVELITRGPNVDRVVVHLTSTLERMEGAAKRKDLRGWAHADAVFHDELIKGAANRRLADLASIVSDLAMRARMVTLPYRPVPLASNSEHAAIVATMNSGDWKTAVKLTREHRMRGLQTVLKALHRMAEER